jgi:hypothetical protein
MYGRRNDSFAHGTAEVALWDTQDNLAVQPIQNVMRGLVQPHSLDFWSFRDTHNSTVISNSIWPLLGQHCRFGIVIHKDQCARGASFANSFSEGFGTGAA